MSLFRTMLASAVALCAASCTGATRVETLTETPTQPATETGARAIDEDHPAFGVYRNYCAVCHGVFADGNGPIAPLMTTPPPDLTRLTAKYGDPLRSDELAEFIDGRNMARGHGTSDMPVWGEQLYSSKRDSTQLDDVRRGTILRIIEYLNAIQTRSGSDG